MSSKTEISNLAISHLGTGKEIADLETERSQESAACRRFYDMALKTTLKAYSWPFATKIAALGLVAEEPNEEWGYSYRYPSDCLEFRRILSGQRTDTRDTRISYKLGFDSAGTLIYADKFEAEGEYTILHESPSFYPPDFTLALSLRLAALVAPRLTAGDPFKLGEKCLALYRQAINEAKANAGNEEVPDSAPDSEFIRAR